MDLIVSVPVFTFVSSVNGLYIHTNGLDQGSYKSHWTAGRISSRNLPHYNMGVMLMLYMRIKRTLHNLLLFY